VRRGVAIAHPTTRRLHAFEDDGEVQEAGPGGDVRDVGDPEPIRALGGERAPDQVGGGPGSRIAARGRDEGPAHPHPAGRLDSGAGAARKGGPEGGAG